MQHRATGYVLLSREIASLYPPSRIGQLLQGVHPDYQKLFGLSVWAVYIALLIRADAETGRCSPSYRTIREDTGLSEHAVRRSLATLGTLGLIRVTPRRGKRTVYRVIGASSQDYQII